MMKRRSNRFWIEVAMAYLIMLLLIALFASSCSTKKKATFTVKENLDYSAISVVNIDSVFRSMLIRDTYTTTNSNLVFDVTIFDTERIDTLTGEHPVKAKIYATNQTEQKHEEHTEQTDTASVSINDTTAISADENINIAATEETRRQKSPFCSFWGFVTVMAALVVLVLGIKAITNKGKWIWRQL